MKELIKVQKNFYYFSYFGPYIILIIHYTLKIFLASIYLLERLEFTREFTICIPDFEGKTDLDDFS